MPDCYYELGERVLLGSLWSFPRELIMKSLKRGFSTVPKRLICMNDAYYYSVLCVKDAYHYSVSCVKDAYDSSVFCVKDAYHFSVFSAVLTDQYMVVCHADSPRVEYAHFTRRPPIMEAAKRLDKLSTWEPKVGHLSLF